METVYDPDCTSFSVVACNSYNCIWDFKLSNGSCDEELNCIEHNYDNGECSN